MKQQKKREQKLLRRLFIFLLFFMVVFIGEVGGSCWGMFYWVGISISSQCLNPCVNDFFLMMNLKQS